MAPIPKLYEAVATTSESNKKYNHIVNVLKDPKLCFADFQSILTDFTQSISLLTSQRIELVQLLLEVPLPRLRQDLVGVYVSFIESLLSAHAYYLKNVLDKTVSYFNVKEEILEGENAGGTNSVIAENKVFSHTYSHEVLFAVVKVIPTCTNSLGDVLKSNFPHRKRGALQHEMYLRNILTVISYVPVLRQQILSLVIHRMIKIDVEIVEKTEEDESSEGEDEESESDDSEVMSEDDDEVQVISTSFEADFNPNLLMHTTNNSFSMKDSSFLEQHIGEQKNKTQGSKIEDESEEVTEAEEVEMESDKSNALVIDEMANKLDIMMTVLFEYLHDMFFNHGEDADGHKVEYDEYDVFQLFLQLLHVFEKVILPTYKSKYTQYLIFYSCSINESLPALFIQFLTKKVFDTNVSAITRQALVMYTASFLARHDKIDTVIVGNTLKDMVEFVHSYIQKYDGKNNGMGIDIPVHRVFYSFCQCVMYVICFRHKALLKHFGIPWFKQLKLDRMINCSLNPLRVCLPAILQEFANITRAKEILYCYTIIERNKKVTLSTYSSLGIKNELETYFPFDPYKLPVSSRFITNYVEWQGGHDEVADDEMMFEGNFD